MASATSHSEGNQLSLLGDHAGGASPGTPPSPHGEARTIERPGLRLRHWSAWLSDEPYWRRRLEREVPWKQELITLWGRTHPLPRLTCWMGDPGCSYTYSGMRNAIEPWCPAVLQLRERLEHQLGVRFNSLLLNLYRDGRDKLNWHADDEPELDAAALIASLSLGAARSFRLRPRDEGRQPADTLSFELGHGDLLVMDPPTQQHWLHQVPQRLRLNQSRLNLTFRCIHPEAISRA